MNDWKTIVKKRMKEMRLSQEKLAEKLGYTQGAIGHWLNGRRQADIYVINDILKELNLPELSIGLESTLSSNQHSNVKNIESTTQLAKNFSYPLIQWDDIEAFIDKCLSSNKIRGQVMSIENIKEGFSLEVKGDSMATMGLNSFPAGTRLIIDSNIKHIESNRFYIVRLPDGTITFKQLIRDAGLSYLRSLNDNYKPIPINENECKFLGLVVDKDLGKLY